MAAVCTDSRRNVLGVLVDAVEPDAAVRRIIQAASERRPYAVTALAVHGVMTAVRDPEFRYRLNHLDLVAPDGQPVRWALTLLHRDRLRRRVSGSTLLDETCAAAAEQGLPVFFYGSRREVLDRLIDNLRADHPTLAIAGSEPSKFRRTTPAEKQAIAGRIRDSGARITFVGLGCPRQEVFVYEYRELLEGPAIAIGAAFDYRAGLLVRPRPFVRRLGLEWLARLIQEPRRLWKRYLLLNPAYLTLLALQLARVWRPKPERAVAPTGEILYA